MMIQFDARAALDPLTGARVSLATTQQMLATPFLPNLSSEHGHLGVQIAYTSARLKGSNAKATYEGRFTGWAVGASYSPPISQDVGHYFTGVYSQNKGSARFDQLDAELTHEFTTAGTVANAGLSLRVFGRDESASIVGLFGGPALLQFDSRLTIDQEIFASSPFIYGALVGVQWRVHLGKFVFNPYALRFEAFTNACTGVATARVMSFDDHCPGDEARVALMPSFNAYGLVFGYGALEANVYAKMQNDRVLRDVRVMNLGLSYTF